MEKNNNKLAKIKSVFFGTKNLKITQGVKNKNFSRLLKIPKTLEKYNLKIIYLNQKQIICLYLNTA